MTCNKPNNDIDWRIIEDSPTIHEILSLVLAIPISSTLIPCHSGKVVKQPNQFMYLEKSFKAIINKHEIDLIDHDKAMSDVDAHLWKKTMEAELESL